MKNYLWPLLLLFVVGGCSAVGDDSQTSDGSDDTDSPVGYWDDTAAKYGLQTSSKEVALYLGQTEYYVTGVNCFDLFTSGIRKVDDKYEFDTSIPFEILRRLKYQRVNVLRFSCIQYYAPDFAAYFDNKEAYLGLLAQIAERAQALQIGIIPSMFWNFRAVNDYYEEPIRSWGRPGSKTAEFITRYTKDVVSTLARYKSVFAWELGNELNLAADLPNWQDAFGTTNPENWFKGDDLNYAARIFTQTVEENDPQGRAIFSGHANLRASQYNQYTNNSWTTDTKAQFRQITDILTPERMQVSEHIYENSRRFADVGEVFLAERLRIAKASAAASGKTYFVGEFGGPDFEGYKAHYEALFSAGIQLSLVWNFSIDGTIEYSFTEESEKGKYLFELIRTYNKKFKDIYQ